jgi:tRNA dimethylallyltransferase
MQFRAGCNQTRRQRSSRAANCRCWSAARCCTSRACVDGLDDLPQADAGAARCAGCAKPPSSAFPACTAAGELDPVTAARLKPNDASASNARWKSSALSGKPMSELLAKAPKTPLPFRLLSIALEPSDRAVLHARIAHASTSCWKMRRRIDGRSTATLRARGDLHPGLPSMRCVGYRQAWEYLDGSIDRADAARQGHCRHAPTGKTPADLAALDAGPDDDRLLGAASR